MGIGSRISACRKRHGLSRELLAKKLNIPWNVISLWETGKAIPNTKEMIELSKLFGVSTDYLLLGDRTVRPKPKKMTFRRKEPPGRGGSGPGKIVWLIGLIGLAGTLLQAGIYFVRATNWFSVWGRPAIEALRMRLVVPLLASLFVISVGVDMRRNKKQRNI